MNTLINSLSIPLAVVAVDYLAVVAGVCADLVAGVRKARAQGRPLTSKGFRRTVDKLSSYCLMLAALTVVDAVVAAATFCINHQSAESALPIIPVFSTLGALGILLIEVKSIFESATEKADRDSALTTLHQIIDIISRLRNV